MAPISFKFHDGEYDQAFWIGRTSLIVCINSILIYRSIVNFVDFKQSTSIALASIALVAVFARTVIRLRYQKRLFVDDVFLYIGVVCLCVALGLLVQFSESMYVIGIFLATDLDLDLENLYSFQFSENSGAYMILTYITIFFVKFSFLFFFRILVRRDHKMIIYWWTVFAIMIVTFPVSVIIVVVPFCNVFHLSSSVTTYVAPGTV